MNLCNKQLATGSGSELRIDLSGLFHFRVRLMQNWSLCSLEDEFLVFVVSRRLVNGTEMYGISFIIFMIWCGIKNRGNFVFGLGPTKILFNQIYNCLYNVL